MDLAMDLKTRPKGFCKLPNWREFAFKKKPIRAEVRRQLAALYGARQGGSCNVACKCGFVGEIYWHTANRGGGHVNFIGLEIDHIVEEFDGGTGELNNLQLLCRKCNRRKGVLARAARNKAN